MGLLRILSILIGGTNQLTQTPITSLSDTTDGTIYSADLQVVCTDGDTKNGIELLYNI